MQTVATFRTRAEAEIAVGMLRSRGLTARLIADDAGGMAPHVQLVVGSYEVRVTEGDAEDARLLLLDDGLEPERTQNAGEPRPSFEPRVARMRLIARIAVGALGFVVIITLLQSVV